MSPTSAVCVASRVMPGVYRKASGLHRKRWLVPTRRGNTLSRAIPAERCVMKPYGRVILSVFTLAIAGSALRHESLTAQAPPLPTLADQNLIVRVAVAG